MPLYFRPDWEAECRICGTSPCVRAEGHECPDTDLCGSCFFGTAEMIDWTEWNQQETIDDLPQSD